MVSGEQDENAPTRILAEWAHHDVRSPLRYVLQVGAICPEDVERAIIGSWGVLLWESYGASVPGLTWTSPAKTSASVW